VNKYGQVEVWDVENFRVNFTIRAHWQDITAMQLIDGGRFLATASKDRSIKIWDLVTSNCVCSFSERYRDSETNGLVQLKPGVLGSTRAYSSEFKLWDTNTCKQITPSIKLGSNVASKSLIKAVNERLVAVGFARKVTVYDLENVGDVVAELKVDGDLTDLEVSGKYLYAGNNKGFVFVWDVNNDFELVKTFRALKENGNLDAFRLRVVSESRLVTWYRKEMCVWNDFQAEGCFTNKGEFENAQALNDYADVNSKQGDQAVYLLTSSRTGYVAVWNLSEKRVLSERKLSWGSISFAQVDQSVLYPESNSLKSLFNA
jgi:WD40 repeat protein